MTRADPMAPWLIDHLIQTGMLTTDRITHHAKPRHCPTCHAVTLTGLDDLLPSRTSVDPTPVTAAGEAFAQLTGRPTYSLDRGELYHRTAGRITHRTADNTPVYATHQCGAPTLPTNPRFILNQPDNQEGPAPF